MSDLRYPIPVEPLSEEDGGFVALVPDLPGCMSGGASPEEAVANVKDAIEAWVGAAGDSGRTIPKPSKHLTLV